MDLEAFNYVERAYFLDPNNFAVHKWMFILLDKKSSYEVKHISPLLNRVL